VRTTQFVLATAVAEVAARRSAAPPAVLPVASLFSSLLVAGHPTMTKQGYPPSDTRPWLGEEQKTLAPKQMCNCLWIGQKECSEGADDGSRCWIICCGGSWNAGQNTGSSATNWSTPEANDWSQPQLQENWQKPEENDWSKPQENDWSQPQENDWSKNQEGQPDAESDDSRTGSMNWTMPVQNSVPPPCDCGWADPQACGDGAEDGSRCWTTCCRGMDV
jgi:hypothetical protein